MRKRLTRTTMTVMAAMALAALSACAPVATYPSDIRDLTLSTRVPEPVLTKPPSPVIGPVWV